MSRGMLARVVLAAAVATCVVSAVLAVVLLTGPTGSTAAGPAPLGPGGPTGPAAALTAVGSAEQVTVIRVVDAVTFDARLAGGRSVVRVRALGVQPPGDCYAAEATAVAQRLLDGRSVRLVSEGPVPASDPFDRRLASATIDRGDYAVLAAEAGIARVYTAGASAAALPPIRDAQARAREAGRGVWGPPCLGSAAAPSTDDAGDPSAGASSSESASSPGPSSAGAAVPRDTSSSG